MRAAFGETARIEGDDAIGLAQPRGHLTHQHPDQRPVVPWCDTDKVLQDLVGSKYPNALLYHRLQTRHNVQRLLLFTPS
jgi:hypothetical protein